MGCFCFSTSKTSENTSISHQKQNPETKNVKHQVLLQIQECTVHLMDQGEAIELAKGEFTLIHVTDDNVSLATIVKVGEDLQWPLTKDEPVVKLDSIQYLFSLPFNNGAPLSYGVTFSQQDSDSKTLDLLDSFLKEHSCFSCSSSTALNHRKNNIDWNEFAPRIEDYNNVLAKAIAGGTGQIVKGIFMCTNAYTNQVQKGGEMIIIQGSKQQNGNTNKERQSNKANEPKKNSGVNKTLKRVRKISKMTEKMSKTMLDGVSMATGSVMGPMVRSQAGKAFLSMVPGEVLLASLDAFNKLLDAAEAAEKQALSATSGAATNYVAKSFGENAGEATEDTLATVGHCAGTAWNIFKIRKAINPASSVSSGLLRNAASIKGRK